MIDQSLRRWRADQEQPATGQHQLPPPIGYSGLAAITWQSQPVEQFGQNQELALKRAVEDVPRFFKCCHTMRNMYEL
jgi:hypothetical protein